MTLPKEWIQAVLKDPFTSASPREMRVEMRDLLNEFLREAPGSVEAVLKGPVTVEGVTFGDQAAAMEELALLADFGPAAPGGVGFTMARDTARWLGERMEADGETGISGDEASLQLFGAKVLASTFPDVSFTFSQFLTFHPRLVFSRGTVQCAINFHTPKGKIVVVFAYPAANPVSGASA